jgi:hypothetical protein
VTENVQQILHIQYDATVHQAYLIIKQLMGKENYVMLINNVKDKNELKIVGDYDAVIEDIQLKVGAILKK